MVFTLVSLMRNKTNYCQSLVRQKMFEQTNGVFQIPYLEDPNNGVKLFESSAIIEYLQKMYGVKRSVVEYI